MRIQAGYKIQVTKFEMVATGAIADKSPFLYNGKPVDVLYEFKNNKEQFPERDVIMWLDDEQIIKARKRWESVDRHAR